LRIKLFGEEQINIKVYLIAISFLLIFCKKAAIEQPQEKILVKISNEATISVNEFIRRAEYTIRPSYCKNNSYIHKKIILNSLIAEKLLALEAEPNNPLTENEKFQLYIQGRKEQAMRQWMHNQEATKKVEIDSSEIKKIYRYAGREFDISYYVIKNSDALKKSWSKIEEDNNNFELVYQAAYSDTVLPKRKITWGNQENIKILKALYSGNVVKGQVLKPIEIDADNYLLIKIEGWKDNLAITEQQVQNRVKKIRETLIQHETAVIWKKNVAQIMSGKSLNFEKDIFSKMSELFFQKYFKSEEEKRNLLTKKIWNLEKEHVKSLDEKELEDILDYPFYSIDGQTWTVKDFNNLLLTHPLIFRNRKMPSKEFASEFRFAIADLMRDYYVTKRAYQKGYDQVNVVQRNADMWQDAVVASYQKEKYLSLLGDSMDTNYIRVIGKYLNTYVDSLQNQYSKKIEIDIEEFENIQFSSIDLLVKQKNQPFQYIVPSFPVLTTDHHLDYMTKLDN